MTMIRLYTKQGCEAYFNDPNFDLTVASNGSHYNWEQTIRVSVTHTVSGSPDTDTDIIILQFSAFGSTFRVSMPLWLLFPGCFSTLQLDGSQPGFAGVSGSDVNFWLLNTHFAQVRDALQSVTGFSPGNSYFSGSSATGRVDQYESQMLTQYPGGGYMCVMNMSALSLNFDPGEAYQTDNLLLDPGSPVGNTSSTGGSLDTAALVDSVNQIAFRNYTLSLNNGQAIFSADGSLTS